MMDRDFEEMKARVFDDREREILTRANAHFSLSTMVDIDLLADLYAIAMRLAVQADDVSPGKVEGWREEAMGAMTDASQLLNTIKSEWLPTGDWTDWDQSVIDHISKLLREFHEPSPPISF